MFVDVCKKVGLYVDCSRIAVEIYLECGRSICSQAYASNVTCMYTSIPGHIIDCSEFI